MLNQCWDCKYWVCDFNTEGQSPIVNFWKGECHRHAPIQPLVIRKSEEPTYSHREAQLAEWPRTSAGNGCGDWEKTE